MSLSPDAIEKILIGVVTAIVVLILSEPIKAAFRKIGELLEDFFQALGFGVQKRYYQALTFDKVNLPLIGRYKDIADPPKLEQVYISLKLDSEKNFETIGWETLFRKPNKRIALIGLPGVGKTTLLNYLLLVFTGRVQKHASLRKELGNPTPLYIRLRKVGGRQISEFIASREYCGEEIPYRYFESRLKQGRCVVLFDGLDEVLDRKDREHIVREIGLFAEKYRKNWILITSRPQGWSKSFFADVEEYAIQKLEPDQVRKFIRDWYRVVLTARTDAAASREDAERAKKAAEESALKEADRLYEALSKKQTLFKEARYPLILVLITLVHRHHRKLPEGRADLYKECLDILLEDWDAEKEIVSPVPLDSKRAVLGETAFKFLELGELEKSLPELEELAAVALPKANIAVSPKEFMAQIIRRSDLLTDFGAGKYGFAHRALQDWLAAHHVKENKDLTHLLLQNADKDDWREVILIAVGLTAKDVRSELLKALLAKGSQSPASLAMAGLSLAEGIQVEPASLRVEITDGLSARLNTTTGAGDFALLSDALLSADPQAMQNWIGSVLSGTNPELQKRVLNSLLPDMGLEQAGPFIPTLANVLADSKAETSLRSRCALTLARLKPEPDSALWKALQSAREQGDAALRAAATWAWCEFGRCADLGLVKISAGEFLMGSSDEDRNAGDDEKPQHTVFLPTYYIGKYPVTADEYHEFVQASGYKPKYLVGILKLTGNHPVTWLNWRDALAFAQWKGLTLPSEAEWEKAASWDDAKKEKRIYPWGNEWRDGYANTEEYWGGGSGIFRKLLRRSANETTTPVGYFSFKGDSPYGCADMSGNVWEWTRSVFKEYPYVTNDDREDINDSVRRVLRGGSFIYYLSYARCAFRLVTDFDSLYNDFGFRVCASPNLS